MWWGDVPQMWGSSQGRRVLLIQERGKGRIRELDRGVVREETEQLPQPVVAGGSGRCTKVDWPRGRRGTRRNRVEVWRCLAPPRPTGCMPARDPSWPEPASAAAVWLWAVFSPHLALERARLDPAERNSVLGLVRGWGSIELTQQKVSLPSPSAPAGSANWPAVSAIVQLSGLGWDS